MRNIGVASRHCQSNPCRFTRLYNTTYRIHFLVKVFVGGLWIPFNWIATVRSRWLFIKSSTLRPLILCLFLGRRCIDLGLLSSTVQTPFLTYRAGWETKRQRHVGESWWIESSIHALMNKNNLKKKEENQLDSITDEPVHRGALDIKYTTWLFWTGVSRRREGGKPRNEERSMGGERWVYK